MGSSSRTRDQTQAPFIGSMEYEPLDHQGSAAPFTFKRGHDSFSALDAPSPRTLADNSDEKPLKTVSVAAKEQICWEKEAQEKTEEGS